MYEIRIQNISKKTFALHKAIAHVKFGMTLSNYNRMLLAESMNKYSEDEKKRIEELYNTIKSED